MKLSEIMKSIKINKEIVSRDLSTVDGRIRGNFEAQAREAEIQLPALQESYTNTFREQAEIVLVTKEVSEDLVKGLKDKKVITVDAQDFYKIVAKSASNLSPENSLTMSAFVELTNAIASISRATKVRTPKPLAFEEGNKSLSLEDNMRDLVRTQFGGAGAEPVWVLFSAVNQALEMNVEGDIVPVVVYNTKGMTSQAYGMFGNVLEVSSEAELSDSDSLIESVRKSLVLRGKIQPKKRNKKQNAEQHENEQEEV